MYQRYILVPLGLMLLSGCARINSWQLNDMDLSENQEQTVSRVEIRLSQGAIDTVAIANVAAHSGNERLGMASMLVAVAVSLSTGDGRIVTRSELSGGVDWLALQQELCPGGELTNFRSVNEYRDYLLYQDFKFGFDADCIQPASAGAVQ